MQIWLRQLQPSLRSYSITALRYLLVLFWQTSLILLIPVLSLYVPGIWQWQFTRFGTLHSFSDQYSQSELLQQFSSVLQYLRLGDNTELDSKFFSEEDLLHLIDVKNLLGVITVLLLIGILARYLMVRDTIQQNKYNRANYYTHGILAILLIVVCLLTAINFDRVFYLIHQVIFANNNHWLLDPQTSNLIKFFSNEVWMEWGILTIVFFISINILLRVRLSFNDIA